MVKLNVDVIYAIAEHIEPNPITFNRLAEVSKDFRFVFTSDWVWRYINVYALETGIRADFMNKVTQDQLPLLNEAWGSGAPRRYQGHGTDNLYLQIGYAAYYAPNEPWTVMNEFWSRQMMWCAVHISGHALRFCVNYLDDKELALFAVHTHGCVLQWLHQSLRADHEVVLAAVARGCPRDCRYHKERESVLKYVSTSLCDDTELVCIAVTNTPHSLQHASTRLRQTAAIIKAAVSVDGSALEHALDVTKENLRLAVETYGLALRWAKSDWNADIELVSVALSNDARALKYAHEKFAASHDIALDAVRSNGLALEYVNDAFKADHEFVEVAVRGNGLALKYAKDCLKSDFSIVRAAVENNGRAIEYASIWTPHYQDLKQIALEHLSLDGKDVAFFFENFYGDWARRGGEDPKLLALRNPNVILAFRSKRFRWVKERFVWTSDKNLNMALTLNIAMALNPKLYDGVGRVSSMVENSALRSAIIGDPRMVCRLTPEQRELPRFKELIDGINDKRWNQCYPNLIAKPVKARSKLPTVRRASGTPAIRFEEKESLDNYLTASLY